MHGVTKLHYDSSIYVEIHYLYTLQMNLLKVESVSKFLCQIKNKWIILCLSFHVNHLITLVEERTFITSAEGFVRKLVNIFASTIDSVSIVVNDYC